MLLPPSTWQKQNPRGSPLFQIYTTFQMLPSRMFLQAGFWEPRSATQNLGCGHDPLARLRAALVPRDTAGHKAGIDLQPSGDSGYLNATRNYVSPILCTEASLPPLRSHGEKRRVRISVGSTNLSQSLQRSAFFFPFVLNPLRGQINKQTFTLQVHKTYI